MNPQSWSEMHPKRSGWPPGVTLTSAVITRGRFEHRVRITLARTNAIAEVVTGRTLDDAVLSVLLAQERRSVDVGPVWTLWGAEDGGWQGLAAHARAAGWWDIAPTISRVPWITSAGQGAIPASVDRFCAYCGSEFTPPTRTSRFCGRRCRTIAARASKTSAAARTARVAVVAMTVNATGPTTCRAGCIECGAECRGRRKYCGADCKRSAVNRRAREASAEKKLVPTLVCEGCGSSFTSRLSTARFCSVRCQQRTRRANVRIDAAAGCAGIGTAAGRGSAGEPLAAGPRVDGRQKRQRGTESVALARTAATPRRGAGGPPPPPPPVPVPRTPPPPLGVRGAEDGERDQTGVRSQGR